MNNLCYVGKNYGEKIAVLRQFNFGENWAMVSVYNYIGYADSLNILRDTVYIYQFDKNDKMTLEKFFMDKSEIIGITEEVLQNDDEDED